LLLLASQKTIFKSTKLIDYIKILTKNYNRSELERNPLLDFYDNVNTSTGEIKTTNRNGDKITPSKNAEYLGLEFKIYDTGTITISGSLHKYWNSNEHNYNDFGIDAINWVLDDLRTKFNLKLENCILKCLELGVNIIPPVPTNLILDNCFLHKTKPFEYQKNSNEGKYKQVQHSQYIIKLYNKALHFRSRGFEIENEILRFEIKFTRMEKLNKAGIFSLNDLMNFGLINFKTNLISEWQNVLFYDNTTRIDTLSTKLKNALLDYRNPNYWTGLLDNNKIENFKYHKKQLQKLVKNNSDRVKETITEIMHKKIEFLNTETTRIDTLTIMSNRVVMPNKESSICKVTGFDISMQKKDSFLLSHTGLKYYYQNDKKVFQEIKMRYLSKNYYKSDFDTQIKELAHNIRNRISNQRIKQSRLYLPNQLNFLNSFK
jgi:hypothetical protein